MASLFAFLHHVAAFTLVAAIAVELAVIRNELTIRTARTLIVADAVYGASAGLVLIVGAVRVFFLEKGAYYYFHSAPFIAKLSLFAAIGLMSIYPTRELLSWRKTLKAGQLPQPGERTLRRMRSVLHWELAGVVALILCAAFTARGVGYLGSGSLWSGGTPS